MEPVRDARAGKGNHWLAYLGTPSNKIVVGGGRTSAGPASVKSAVFVQ